MSLEKAPIALLCAVLLIACFAFLGDSDVVSMEGIVADGARHMLRAGDWSVPHLYGEVYAYKPPMAYWLSAASFRLTNTQNEWTLRLPIALTVAVSSWLTFVVLRSVLRRWAAAYCVIASITGLLALQKIQVAEFDMLLASGVMVAVVSASVGLARQRESAGLWLLCYVGLAFAFLSKGLPAIAFYAPGLLFACWLMKSFRVLFTWHHALGVVVCVLITGAWAGAAASSEGRTVYDHMLADMSSRGVDWSWSDVGLTLLKPLALVVIMLPWSLAVPAGLKAMGEDVLDATSARLVRAVLVFVVCGTLIFMLTPTHNMRYLLPLCGPIGVLAGIGVSVVPRLKSSGCRDHTQRAAVVMAVLSACGAAVAMYVSWENMQCLRYAVVLAIVTVATGVALWKWRRNVPVALLSTAACLWAVDRCAVRPMRAETRSMRSIAADFDNHIPDRATVFVDTGDSYSSLFFYLARPVNVFDSSTSRLPAGKQAILSQSQRDAIACERRPTVEATGEYRGRVILLCRYTAEGK